MMPLMCYHYRHVYHDINDTFVYQPCEGPFEKCRVLRECPASDGLTNHHCFAAANKTESKLDNGTIIPGVTIFGAGCYNSPSPNGTCVRECLAIHQTPLNSQYCCCTENGCNNALTPMKFSPQPQSLPPPPPPLNPLTVGHQFPVMFIVVLFSIVILSAYLFSKKRYFKYKRNGITTNSCGAGGNTGSHNFHLINGHCPQNQLNNMNRQELNELRNTDVSIMMPLRNSYDHNQQFGIFNQRNRSRMNNNPTSINSTQTSCLNTSNTRTNNLDMQSTLNRSQDKIIDLNHIRLLEVIGSGRFGRVHRAELRQQDCPPRQTNEMNPRNRNLRDDEDTIVVMGGSNCNNTQENNQEQIENSVPPHSDETNPETQYKEVAVKVIPTRERQSWQNELDIYCSGRAKHVNILGFHGWCVNPETESHWLCIEFASRGSLHHYLKENTVTWPQFLSIVLGILRGLSHLHDHHVVHRDFKSKNVLLRDDLSPCISDFGVAAIVDVDIGTQQRKLFQVGTPRYMSPEILECSIVFGIKNFMKIDIYAAALVIWELLTRCYPLPVSSRAIDQGPMPYKLPYEDYVGPDPDIETMRKVVCKERLRPPLRPEWALDPIEPICRSLRESWEYDDDARVSATCFVERIELLYSELNHRR